MKRSNTRRQFLVEASGLACLPSVFPGFSLEDPRPKRPKKLVLIELFGGLDPLSVLVPYKNDHYRKLRPTLGFSSKRLLRANDEFGFPPHLASLRKLWNAGHLKIIEGVGHPNSTLSHFSARIVWGAGMPGFQAVRNGWAARLRRHLWADDARAELLTHLGSRPSPALVAAGAPVFCFDNPEDVGWIAPPKLMARPQKPEEAIASTNNSELASLRSIQETLSATTRLAPVVQALTAAHAPMVEYPRTRLASRLRTIAGLITGDFPGRVYSLEHGSFDIHSSDTSQTRRVPFQFSEALHAFVMDLKGSSALDGTLILCYSEFGRRPQENSAGGCDHGAAGMMFLLGGGIHSGIIGRRPSLTKLDANGNMIPNLDFREIYAAIIEQWFGTDHVPVMLEKLRVPKLF